MNKKELKLMIKGLDYHIQRCREEDYSYSSRILETIDELEDKIAECDSVGSPLRTELDDIMGVGELPYGLTIIKP